MNDVVTSIVIVNRQGQSPINIDSGAVDQVKITNVTRQDKITISEANGVPTPVRITNKDIPDIISVRNIMPISTVRIAGSMTQPGPPGPPGSGGVGNTYLTAGLNLGGQRVIATDTSGMAQYADNLSLYKTVTGISKTAVSLGELVEVETFGLISDPSWNWDVTKDIFLGQNGLIVQDVPITGAIVNLGHVVSPTSIFLNIDDFIERG